MSIAIKRGPLPADNFTIIPNSWTRDETLTWGARGLLAWLHSHTDGFEITEETIIGAGPMGRDGVRALVRELEERGYLARRRTPIVTGGSTVEYILTDPRGTDFPSLGSDGKSVLRDDQAEQGVSAGKPTDGKSVPRSSVEEQEKNKKTPSSSSRATRVPEDFQPDEKMRAWFVAERIAEAGVDGRVEHEKFMDYFRSAPGVKGRKTDWPATWRNWMRTAAERSAPRAWKPGSLAMPVSGAPYRPSTTDQRVAQGLALAAQFREEESK